MVRIQGIIEKGRLTLGELPEGNDRTEVIVAFSPSSPRSKFIRYRMLPKPGGRFSSSMDFQALTKEFEPKEREEVRGLITDDVENTSINLVNVVW